MWDTHRLEALISNVPGAIYRCSAGERLGDAVPERRDRGDLGPSRRRVHRLVVRTFASVIHPDDRELVEHCVGAALERRDAFELEYRLVHADGSVRWVYERGRGIFDAAGDVQFLDGAIFDITARKQAEERLSHLAYHDALTDLPNRTLFQEHLDDGDRDRRPHRRSRRPCSTSTWTTSSSSTTTSATASATLLLVEVARRLRRVTRAGDVVARQGGDEFLILVTGGRDAHASPGRPAPPCARPPAGSPPSCATRLIEPFLLGDVELYVTASVGASIYPDDADVGRDAAEARRRRALRRQGRRPRRLSALPPDRPRPEPRAQPRRPPAARRRARRARAALPAPGRACATAASSAPRR